MKTKFSFWLVISLFVLNSFISCSKEEVPHLNCVEDFTSEFPFSNALRGTLVTDWDYGHYEFVFNDDGTFNLNYGEFCFSHLEDRYCGLTEADTFNLEISGLWGPHAQIVTEHENTNNCGGIGNPFSSCDVIFTYNQLTGTAPFTVLESNFAHYKGQSGLIEYLMMCGPIQGASPVPPYRYFRQLAMYFNNDAYELEAYWQLEYDE